MHSSANGPLLTLIDHLPLEQGLRPASLLVTVISVLHS